MKRKWYAFFLAAVLGTVMISGCGGSDDGNDKADSQAEESENTGETRDKKLGGQEEDAEDGEEEESTGEAIDFEEQVVLDTDECLIKITEIDPDNDWGYTLKVYLENKSADVSYDFYVESAAVNGVQTDPYFGTTVAAGKKSNEEINFYDEIFEDGIIEDFTDIELTFVVNDSEEWETVSEETVHVYPYGEENAVLHERAEESTDEVILDNEYLKATVIGYTEDDTWGYGVKLYIENKTDRSIQISADDVSVNGFMIEPYYGINLSGDKVSYSTMWFDEDDLTANDIDGIEEIEFRMLVYDTEDWTDLADEVVIIEP